MNRTWQGELAEAIFRKTEDKLKETTVHLYKSGRLNIFPVEVLELTEMIPNKSVLDYVLSLESLLGKETSNSVYKQLIHLVSLLMDEVEGMM